MTDTNTLTGYKVAKLANTQLTEAGLNEIRPQMVYNYMKKGFIKTVEVDGQNKVEIEVAQAWIDAYIAKKTAKANEAEVEEQDLETV